MVFFGWVQVCAFNQLAFARAEKAEFRKFLQQITFLVQTTMVGGLSEEEDECISTNFGTNLTFVTENEK